MRRRTALVVAAVAALALAASALAGKPKWQDAGEHLTDRLAVKFIGAVPYPEAAMRDSLERRNLSKRLLRFNKPQKIGYLYVMSFGKFVGYYVVKGKVSSVQSQLTNTQQTFREGSHDTDGLVIDSMGDDGTWGPNEGGDRGVFFFTATDVMVETTLDWIYSDAPLHIDVPNLLARK